MGGASQFLCVMLVAWSLPPHPNPLPKERGNYPQSLPHRRRFDLGTESAAPSPWGEGWGEGDRIDARQRTSRRQLDLSTENVEEPLWFQLRHHRCGANFSWE